MPLQNSKVEGGLLIDPVELRDHQARGDPPLDLWPGTPVGRQDIMKASGDPRDWFRYRHREEAAEEVWAEFADAQNRRPDLTAGFEWNQILILGDFGSGKTALGVKHARNLFRRGHPVFHNASALFGWRLTPMEIYTAMAFVPKGSVIIIDESSAALASRLGHSVAVTTMVEIGLNIRKQLCHLILISAQDWAIASAVRRDCKEVWMPIPKDQFIVEADGGASASVRVEPANDVNNFRSGYYIWDDFPYKKTDLILGPENAKDGFGPPTHVIYCEGEEVRKAFLLNDSFELAMAGAATLADKDVIKENLAQFHARLLGGEVNGSAAAGRDEATLLLDFLDSNEGGDLPEYMTAAQLGSVMGVGGAVAGGIVQEWFHVDRAKKGYPLAKLLDYVDKFKQGEMS